MHETHGGRKAEHCYKDSANTDKLGLVEFVICASTYPRYNHRSYLLIIFPKFDYAKRTLGTRKTKPCLLLAKMLLLLVEVPLA